ncbi:coiled-coil domain-containing protein [Allorhizocola rhizosphaerae]|uniref:coiled-coil domain-containing protein n=1 Tax=Allorhizocola rhizosphaerae TaxID=1872709 RepID=UPI001FEB9FD2|nr:hypothetical protein [Allorhizocola rhizosphaerae]
MRLRVATSTLVVLALVLGTAASGFAQPAPTNPPNEGSTPTLQTLRDNLQAASAAYIEAEAKLDASKQRQAELEGKLRKAEEDMAKVRAGVARYAGEAYKNGRLGAIGMMLNSSSPDAFIERAAALDKMTQRDQGSLVALLDAKRRAADAKAGIDREVGEQQVAVDEMNKRKIAAERALAAVSGGNSAGTSTRVNNLVGAAPSANPAPRNDDGSWPSQSCSEDDPTTPSGCSTPRNLHALREGWRVGYDWHVSCHRSGGDGEHPKGRACDWAAFQNGFVNSSAGGNNRTYGDKVAAFYIKNAKALGVMYVVWYCQIWQVSIGWRRYNSTGSNCGDAPAGDHTNHVHVSIY